MTARKLLICQAGEHLVVTTAADDQHNDRLDGINAMQKTYVEGESLEEFRLAASAGNIGILFFRASALPFVQVIHPGALTPGLGKPDIHLAS